MSALNSCPPVEALSNFLLGKLDAAARESVASHIEACDTCLSRLDEVDQASDSLVNGLRQPPVDDKFMQEPECQLAVQRSQQLAYELGDKSEILRDYELVEKLGEGGMGAVYRALHKKLDKWVAVKLLPTERLHSPEAVSRFGREMRAIGRLHHPNIVQAHDAGEADGQHYLVMELVEGMDLATLVRRVGPLPIADACEIVRQVALGLQHAHDSELVHRDIKPSNVMLTPGGEMKILDLGLARLEEPLAGEHEVTSEGQIMGTLDYMAPEQLGDSHAVDHRADIYSLGATLYKLLTGQAPYADQKYNTPQKKLMAIATKPIESADDHRAGISHRLTDVLDRMLAKNPDERFDGAAEIATVLMEFSAGADLPALYAQASELTDHQADTKGPVKSTFDPFASSFTDTDAIGSLAKPQATTTPRSAAKVRRRQTAGNRQRLLIGGVVGLLLLAGFGYLLGIVFKIDTPDGSIQIETNVTDVDIYVDNQKVVYMTDPKDRTKIRIEIPKGAETLRVSKEGFEADVKEFKLNTVKGPIHVSFVPRPKEGRVPTETGPPLAVAPFDADSAKQRQTAWAAHLGLPVVWKNSLGIEFVFIPPGEFLMGSTNQEQTRFLDQANAADDRHAIDRIPLEGPKHRVKITQPFYFGKFEVTRSQWESVMEENPSHIENPSAPVDSVDWADAHEFLNRVNRYYSTSGMKFVLPTEAQWEYAARAGSATTYYYGEDESVLDKHAWFGGDVNHAAHEVGQLGANPWGLHDIYGNVWEWCSDREWVGNYYSHSPVNDPLGPLGGSFRIGRGGSWRSNPAQCRSAFRASAHWGLENDQTGFRIAAIMVVSRPGDISRNEPDKLTRGHPTYSDREVAEWALRVGGGVTIRIGMEEQELGSVESLPPEAFHVVALNLEGTQTSDDDLVRLRGLSQLERLNLSVTQVSNEGLVSLDSLLHLKDLNLYLLNVTDAGFEHLKKLASLESLELTATPIGDLGLSHFQEMKRLRVLQLKDTKVTDAGLSYLKPMVQLTRLELRGTQVTETGMEHLMDLPQLQHLWLDGSQLASDVGVEHLKSVRRLKSLFLQDKRVTDATLTRLESLTQIKSLTLYQTKVTDGGLKSLGRLSSLRTLRLHNNAQVTDAAIDQLKKLSGLRDLRFNHTQFTEVGMRRLKEVLPNCEIVAY